MTGYQNMPLNINRKAEEVWEDLELDGEAGISICLILKWHTTTTRIKYSEFCHRNNGDEFMA